MASYSTLRKIIPPDQALANKALARGLGQVKDIFNTTLPEFAAAVGNLESNKGLTDINDLAEPVPADVQAYWTATFSDGTGPGNTVTVNDMLGTAAGNSFSVEMPTVITVLTELNAIGNLDPLTGNGGSPSSVDNGLYTLMQYTLAEAYGNVGLGINIPSTNYYAGGSFSDFDDAFGNGLVPAANAVISGIAANNTAAAAVVNTAWAAMSGEIALNVENCSAAELDIGTIVLDIANANLVSNSRSSVLSIATSLHAYGTDITEGGAAQWWTAVANINTRTGQAVIASLREGRNIAALSLVNVATDTQLPDTEPDPVIANTLGQGQYSVAEARANLQY